MKTPESPRSYLPKLAEPPPVAEEKEEHRKEERKEEKIVPRYVHLPALREHGFGPRNLFWGVVLLFLALILMVVALLLAGSKAIIFLATCLITFTALFVLARMHIFRQRNGGFLALAVVCLLGAAAPLIETAFGAAKSFVAQRTPAAVTTTTAPTPGENETPSLVQSFALSKPEGNVKQVRVLKDSRVPIGGKTFLIKAGDAFAFVEAKGDETTFAVRDLHVALPNNVVEVIDPMAVARGVAGGQRSEADPAPAADKTPKKPTPEQLAEITKGAQTEAMRRYPALSVRDSLENAAFVSTYKQLKDAGSTDFFSNPEWPLELAELLAKREGWVRGGGPMTTGPAPVLDAPVDNGRPEPAPRFDAGPADTTDRQPAGPSSSQPPITNFGLPPTGIER